MKIAIVTDSITNLTQEDLEKYANIHYVYLNVIINDQSYTDLIEMDNAKLFKAIDEGAAYSTSQPSPKAFVDVYEKLLKDYDFIFSLHCSETVSGTVNSARIASEIVDEAGEKISVIDMRTASIGVENTVIQAAEVIAAGKTKDEVAALIEFNRQNTKLYLTIDDLSTLVRSGRMTKGKAAIGNLLNIKPIISFNEEAKLDVAEKVRTKKKVLKWILDALAWDVAKSGEQVVRITHVNAKDVAEELKSMVTATLGKKVEVHISNEIGPVMAVHFGRGGFGASWVTKKS